MIEEKIPVLSRKQELDLLKTAKNNKNKEKRTKAIRLLMAFNQPFVKYIVRSYPYNRKEIDPEDLIAEGTKAAQQAIESFDLEKAEKHDYRFATYAGYWIRQYIQAFIRRSKLLPRSVEKQSSESEWEDEEDKQKTYRYNVIYYDREYQTEKDDKPGSLMDTLSEENEEDEERQNDIKRKINSLLSNLEPRENLIVRLSFGVIPLNLAQIYPLVNSEWKMELEKLKGQEKLANVSLAKKKKNPLVKKCLEIFSVVRKKEESVVKEISKTDFWQYFIFHSEKEQLACKNLSIHEQVEKNWLEVGIKKSDIAYWINLGYQPEDAKDDRNHILQNIGVSKKEQEIWKKPKINQKNKNWFDCGLERLIAKWKKKILIKLKETLEKERKK